MEIRNFSVEKELKKKLAKLFRKDRTTYDSAMSKMQEIISCENINRYKNLKKPLQHFKRVHINRPFVLTFRYVEEQDKILFYDMDHHDKIYR